MRRMTRLAIVVALSAFLASCCTRPPDKPAAPAGPVYTPPAETFSVSVDERVELFSILFRLAGVKEYGLAPNTAYVQEVDKHFAKFREHPAVDASWKMHTKHSIGYNAPVGLAVYLDSAETLTPLVPLKPHPAYLDDRWKDAPVASYLKKVRDFVSASGFTDFMRRHRDHFQKVEDRYRQAAQEVDLLPWMDDFFGPKPGARVVLIPGMLNGGHGYGCAVKLGDGTDILSPILGVGQVDEQGLPLIEDKQSFIAFLQHEVAHAYVNPCIDRHEKPLESAGTRVFDTVADTMKSQAYDDWLTVVKESAIRASTVLFMRDKYGEKAANASLQHHQGKSFFWLPEVIAELEQYRKQRAKYPDFDTFTPRLAAALERWLARPEDQRYPPFMGPINAVWDYRKRNPKNTLLVAPIETAKDKASGQALAYVQKMYNTFFVKAGAPMISSGQVKPGDLAGKALVLYGTPDTNPVLRRFLGKLDWKLAPDKITLGKRSFKGKRLFLIASHPRPCDQRLPVAVYAAARSQDIIKINSIFHGPTDWVVGQQSPDGKPKEIAKGNFEKTAEGKWLPLAKK